MACNTNSLSNKIVISVCDGRKLGHICNYEVDLCNGCIAASHARVQLSASAAKKKMVLVKQQEDPNGSSCYIYSEFHFCSINRQGCFAVRKIARQIDNFCLLW